MTPLRSRAALWRQVNGQAVVVQTESGNVHELNAAGTLLWSLADGSRDLEAIAAALEEKYDVPAVQARQDVQEFFRELAAAGMIE